MLRGQPTLENLKDMSERLKAVMTDYPKPVPAPGGDICRLGRAYIKIADHLLAGHHPGISSR